MTKFKEGDRVYWVGKDNEFDTPDSGIIVKDFRGSIYEGNAKSRIWVKWDSDGKVLHVLESELRLIVSEPVPTNSFTEEQAVMFLLAKGYRVEKISVGLTI